MTAQIISLASQREKRLRSANVPRFIESSEPPNLGVALPADMWQNQCPILGAECCAKIENCD